MRISQTRQKSNQNQAKDISVDVHKDMLNFFFEAGGKEYSDECSNRTTIIMGKLEAYHRIALAQGMKTLRIICEPTGEYHRTARKMGFLTCFVNAESVAKFRLIETNNTGKTDTKDPRVIRTLGRLNKLVTDRMIGEDYMVLRKLGMMYDEGDRANTRLRCRIDRLLVELFCDYSFKKNFLYTPSGMALVDEYGCNPPDRKSRLWEILCPHEKGSAPNPRREPSKTLERCHKLCPYRPATRVCCHPGGPSSTNHR
ncbi:MAG: Transposase [Syntrophorhabdus sp. PtaU1.Bin153]|nr:MAG: Transposase [Syntrophorhabdus sp. PtaU1.Bin153]